MRHDITVALLGVGLWSGCGGDPDPIEPPSQPPVASITLNLQSDTVVVRSVVQFQATVRDADGNPLEDRQIEWLSSDPFIATVDNGRVQTKALGVVTITATSESHRASAQLTMAPNVAVSRRLPTVFAGDTTQLVAALTDADGNLIGTGPDGWTSSDEGVAMVSTDGIVTGVSPGRATITASREAGSGGVELVVLDPAPRPARELTYVRFSATDELRRIGADGGGAIPLSDTERSVGHYDWSPLGDRLAISYYPWFGEGVAALFVENADGSDPRELLPDSVYRPAWSPDGERIAVEQGAQARSSC